ncbi:MAG TPA: CBS domain-containing protein [Pseudomonadales bacterium]
MSAPNPLKVAFARRHAAEVAAHVANQSYDAVVQTLHGLPVEVGAGVIAKLPHAVAVKLLASQTDERVAAWLSQAALDDALSLVLHLDQARRENVLARLPIRHIRQTLERLVIYPTKTVGAIVDPTVARLDGDTPLDQAVEMLRAEGENDVKRVWIVDGDARYRGLLDLSRALLARSGQLPVGELAVRPAPLRAETALAAALDVGEWLEHPELPVVDHRGHLLGALSRQRLATALEAEKPVGHGVLNSVTALTEQYFRVLGICLGDLLAGRRT